MAKIDDNEEIGIGGFTAMALVREQETRTANIPSIPLEDGSIAHDHIILNPVKLNIEGRVSDIFLRPLSTTTVFRRNLAEIGNITKYLPPRTQSQINRAAALVVTVDGYVRKVDAAIIDGRQASEFFGSKDGSTSFRDQFLETLDYYYDNRILMRIETRKKIYEKMFITSRVISRDNTSNDVIDFKITAQQLRFSEVIFTEIQTFFSNPASGTAADQVKGQESKGLNDAPEVDSSILFSILGT